MMHHNPVACLQELAAVQRTIRELRRQAKKDQARYAEIARAYVLTVANLVKTSGECTALERERDEWQRRTTERATTSSFADGRVVLTPDEIAAIRKAIARLHHPDVGGDATRMQAWNALLDELAQR